MGTSLQQLGQLVGMAWSFVKRAAPGVGAAEQNAAGKNVAGWARCCSGGSCCLVVRVA